MNTDYRSTPEQQQPAGHRKTESSHSVINPRTNRYIRHAYIRTAVVRAESTSPAGLFFITIRMGRSAAPLYHAQYSRYLQKYLLLLLHADMYRLRSHRKPRSHRPCQGYSFVRTRAMMDDEKSDHVPLILLLVMP